MRQRRYGRLLGVLMVLGLHGGLTAIKPTRAQIPQGLRDELSARQQKLAKADQLFSQGQKQAAKKIYRQVQKPWPKGKSEQSSVAEPIAETDALSPAGQVFWRQAQQGLEKDLKSAVLAPLKHLVEEAPAFVPGQIAYARALKRYGQTEKAIRRIEAAASRYPGNADLTAAQVELLESQEKWLHASIAARQYALTHPQASNSARLARLADKNMERYQSELKAELTGSAVASGVVGALTGQEEQATRMAALMLQGESQVGKQLANSMREQAPLVKKKDTVNYVREIGQNLAELMGRDEFDYEFYVIEKDVFNAFALPGGKIFVYSGALSAMDSEAELAGLLAHEIAHAVASHGYRSIAEGMLLQNVGQAIPLGKVISGLARLEYSRQDEREADVLGLYALNASKYSVDGMRNLMVTMRQESASSKPAWARSHPVPESRLRYVEQLIQRRGYERHSYHGIVPYAQMRQALKKVSRD